MTVQAADTGAEPIGACHLTTSARPSQASCFVRLVGNGNLVSPLIALQ